jgi:hypothetical protein
MPLVVQANAPAHTHTHTNQKCAVITKVLGACSENHGAYLLKRTAGYPDTTSCQQTQTPGPQILPPYLWIREMPWLSTMLWTTEDSLYKMLTTGIRRHHCQLHHHFPSQIEFYVGNLITTMPDFHHTLISLYLFQWPIL